MLNDGEVVGHISLRLPKTMSMFLKLTGSQMEVEVTGKYVNWGIGYELEIPCKYLVTDQEKGVAWVWNRIHLIIKKHECVVNRCFDEKIE